MQDETPAAPVWLRPAAEYGPIVLFFAATLLYDLMVATGVIVIATLISLAVTWFYERRIPLMPLVTAGVVAVFGGLTLWLQDEIFIKMKPTIVQLIFAAILLGGLAFNQPLLKPLLGKALPAMSDAGWHGLTLRYSLFFLVMAALNELVWRTQSTEFWVTFKLFGIMGLTIGFILLQMPFMNRHMLETEGAADADVGWDNKAPAAGTGRSDEKRVTTKS